MLLYFVNQKTNFSKNLQKNMKYAIINLNIKGETKNDKRRTT